MATIDELIAQRLRDSQRSGELQSAARRGRPLPGTPQAPAIRKRLGELQQHLALRLERLRAGRSL